MAGKIREQSATYVGKETANRSASSVSFLADGMETRISAAADAVGTRTAAAEAMRVSVDSLQRYIRGERVIGLDAAAALCEAGGTRLEWLAFNRGPMLKADETATQSQSQPVSQDVLSIAIQLVEEALEGKALETAKRAELVALVYEGLVEGMPEAKVLRWARAAGK